jgi:hypothetical protein
MDIFALYLPRRNQHSVSGLSFRTLYQQADALSSYNKAFFRYLRHVSEPCSSIEMKSCCPGVVSDPFASIFIPRFKEHASEDSQYVTSVPYYDLKLLSEWYLEFSSLPLLTHLKRDTS